MGTSRSDSAIPRAPSSASVIPVHTAVRGRARFKVAGLYRSPHVKRLLESSLSTHQAINQERRRESVDRECAGDTFDTSYDVGQVVAIIAQATTVDAPENDAGISSRSSAVVTTKGSWKARISQNLRSFRDQVAGKKEPEHLPWHTMDSDQVVARTGSSLSTGLTAAAAMERIRVHGPNILPESVPRSQLAILLDQLSSTPILLLIAAAGTSILTGGQMRR